MALWLLKRIFVFRDRFLHNSRYANRKFQSVSGPRSNGKKDSKRGIKIHHEGRTLSGAILKEQETQEEEAKKSSVSDEVELTTPTKVESAEKETVSKEPVKKIGFRNVNGAMIEAPKATLKPISDSYPWPSYSDRLKLKKTKRDDMFGLKKRQYSTFTDKKVDMNVKNVIEDWINKSQSDIRIDQLNNKTIQYAPPKQYNPFKKSQKIPIVVPKEEKKEEEKQVPEAVEEIEEETPPTLMTDWYAFTGSKYVELNKYGNEREENFKRKNPKFRKQVNKSGQRNFSTQSRRPSMIPRLVKKYSTGVARADDDKDLYKRKTLPILVPAKFPIGIDKKQPLKDAPPLRRLRKVVHSEPMKAMSAVEDFGNKRADDDVILKRKALPAIP